METQTIAIIGGGNMGTSLIGGLRANGWPADKLWVADHNQEKLKKLKEQFAINTTCQSLEAVTHANIVILAVKPQSLAKATRALSSLLKSTCPLIISVAAGISISSLKTWLQYDAAIIRAMPNTPALIKCGATALYANSKAATDFHRHTADTIFTGIGKVAWLNSEAEIDSATALSGSGPAYFFLLMAEMQKTAEKFGLPKETAKTLTLQTAFGAAAMALASQESTEVLCHQVTSPGGTTEAALSVFLQENFPQLVTKALTAAKNKARELAKQFENEE